MKMGVPDRVLLFIGALVAMLTGLLLIVGSLFGVVAVPHPAAAGGTTWGRWVLPLMGLTQVLFGAYILLLLKRIKRRQNSFVLTQTDDGEMRISVAALEDIVRRCALMQRGITLRDTQITRQRDAVAVDVVIASVPGVDLPRLAGTLQQDIRRAMLSDTGIRAADVKVTVDSMSRRRLFRRGVQAHAPHAAGGRDAGAERAAQAEDTPSQEEK